MDDLISRAAIEWHDFLVADGNGMYHEEKVAYKRQIDTLPSAQPEPCEDAVSRQAAIDVVKWGITYAKAINKSTGEVKELFMEGNKALNEAVKRLKELPSAQPSFSQCQENDCISRKSVIKSLRNMRKESDNVYVTSALLNLEVIVQDLLPTEPDTWMEQNRERILQAGMEGREVEFRIGGRLFAIREKAQ